MLLIFKIRRSLEGKSAPQFFCPRLKIKVVVSKKRQAIETILTFFIGCSLNKWNRESVVNLQNLAQQILVLKKTYENSDKAMENASKSFLSHIISIFWIFEWLPYFSSCLVDFGILSMPNLTGICVLQEIFLRLK